MRWWSLITVDSNSRGVEVPPALILSTGCLFVMVQPSLKQEAQAPPCMLTQSALTHVQYSCWQNNGALNHTSELPGLCNPLVLGVWGFYIHKKYKTVFSVLLISESLGTNVLPIMILIGHLKAGTLTWAQKKSVFLFTHVPLTPDLQVNLIGNLN